MPPLNVVIDDKSGFCFGVVRAISEAEKALADGKEVFSLGDLVHNRMEVQRLEALGLKTISHADISAISGKHMLVRAHGEPPSTYVLAEGSSVNVIDATCPVVAALQKKVRKAWECMKPLGGTVVIFGKHGHAEVVGLTGQVSGEAVVIECEEEIESVDFTHPVYFLSQTTQSVSRFHHIAGIMRSRLGEGMLTVDDTICRRVSSREEHIAAFAREYDVVVFVCGRKSSNGRILFDVCRGNNPRTYLVEEEDELEKEWFSGAGSVGVCGATSTPEWLMERIAEGIVKIGTK